MRESSKGNPEKQAMSPEVAFRSVNASVDYSGPDSPDIQGVDLMELIFCL
jgi:hypothetical protein